MNQVIGFAEKYYTLWSFNDDMTDGYFVKNLSMDFDLAKSKVDGEYTIDLNQRGLSSWDSSGQDLRDAEDDEFSFGALRNDKIMEATDLWQLERAGKEETPGRQKIAVKRLMQLGEYDFVPFRNGYWTRAERDEIRESEKELKRVASLKGGHHYSHGDKVELELKELDSFWFESSYGGCAVVTYESKDGKIFKYLGSRPTDEIGNESFHKVCATIKHSEYNHKDETKLLRIKVIK